MNVKVGLGTIVGYGYALLSVTTAIITAISSSEYQLAHGPAKWVVILTAINGTASAIGTTFGRQAQAAAVAAPAPEAPGPTLAEELQQQPPSVIAVVPDGAVPVPPPAAPAPPAV